MGATHELDGKSDFVEWVVIDVLP
ncbi:uncharacterized protein METZ01_LOCUS15309 [marine metagenome]|uniref:Uncharacterized protein n=1 Tax=marine metagenome TaxID=408172 RepID=A0A381P680_9ZZZZ